MKKFLLASLLLLAAAAVQSQSPHSATIGITQADTSPATPGTATLYRASGSCPTTGLPTGATVLSSKISVAGTGTYTDQTVTPGNYCFYATVTLGGQTSGSSNTFQGTVTLALPTITVTVN